MSSRSINFLIENASSPGQSEPKSVHHATQYSNTTPIAKQLPSTKSQVTARPLPVVVIGPSPVSLPRPPTPKELESLEMEEPLRGAVRAAETVQTVWDPYMNRFRFASCCLTSLCGGLNDSAPGALLPYIEEDYSIGYAIVSLIFVANALGFVSAAFFINHITDKYGRSKALMIAEALLIVAYVTIVASPPFPVVVAAFFVAGMGAATNLAINQVFCANLHNGPVFSGIYQGLYGVGGTVGPLIATSLVSHGSHWTKFYFITLAVSVLALGGCGWAFWGYEKETPQHIDEPGRTAVRVSRWRKLGKIISNKPTLIGALFIFAYQGSEVAISGWVISFLVSYRGGDIDKVGYVTAGFWAGITLGRFLLSHLGSKIGERRFVMGLTAGTMVLQLLVWFVPSIIGNSIAVALAGVLLGPIYPGATALLIRLLPRHMQVSSFSFIASVGSSGGAFVPFMTGLLAQQAGTWVLHPICIGLFVAMEVLWFLLPEAEKRSE